MTISKRDALYLLAASLAVVGCVPFPDALSTDADSFVDARLVGEWLVKDRELVVVGDNQKCTLNVSGPAPEDTEPLDIFEFTGEPGELPFVPDEAFVVRATRIGEETFLSIPIRQGPADEIRWVIMRYTFLSDDEVHLFAMNTKKLLKAVKDGHLAGELKKSTPGPILRLLGDRPHEYLGEMSARRDDLRKYLKDHPIECFDAKPEYILKRKAKEE